MKIAKDTVHKSFNQEKTQFNGMNIIEEPSLRTLKVQTSQVICPTAVKCIHDAGCLTPDKPLYKLGHGQSLTFMTLIYKRSALTNLEGKKLPACGLTNS